MREIQNETTLSVIPNPVFNVARVHFNHVVTDADLMLMNTVGQTVMLIQHVSGNEVVFKRENLPAGIYVIRITEHKCTVATGKVLISD
ncbi:hypothetical protein DSECCO2_626600 [anaerobic digester metagenome]